MNREDLARVSGLNRVDQSDSGARVPLSAAAVLWQTIARNGPRSGFGIRAGASLRVHDIGLVGYAMSSSETLEDALRRMVRYTRVMTSAVEFVLEDTGQELLSIREMQAVPGVDHPLAVDYRFAALLSICRQITRVEIVPQDVSLSHERPPCAHVHTRFFQCRPAFGQPVTRITFHKRDLALPLPRADAVLARHLSQYAERMLDDVADTVSIRERVRASIWSVLSEGRPTLARVASSLDMAPRTLQRHLASDGTTLEAEIEDIRRATALTILRTQSARVEDLAFQLGYREASTLFRALKRWTGLTPGQFRNVIDPSSE